MTNLKDVSMLWSIIHVLVMFALLFESRYSKRKTVILTACTMVPLLAANFIIYQLIDAPEYLALLGTCVLPSLAFFLFIAKYRDGRLLFTFCLSDTVWLEIMYITNILDFYFGNQYIFMFVSRLILYPLTELFFWKILRPMLFDMQKTITRGWYSFSAISAIFYVMMLFSMSYPTMITQRPQYLPGFVMQLILMPLIYAHIFITLRRQQRLYESREMENILSVQVQSLRSRINEFAAANEMLRAERHDFRHKMRTIAVLAENGQLSEVQAAALEYAEAPSERTIDSYCDHAILDAVLSSYLQFAKHKDIRVSVSLDLPKPLPVNETELATVFANAIENAIQACEKIEPAKRFIEVKTITYPAFMLQVQNSFDGIIAFDENGLPLCARKGHGFGTRSIATFCEKNNAFCEFGAEDEVFHLRMAFQ